MTSRCHLRRAPGRVRSLVPTKVVKQRAEGMDFEVNFGRQSGIVVDGGSTEEPRPIHMSDKIWLKVGLNEGASLLHERRVDNLDIGNGGEGHCVVAWAPLVRYSSRRSREGEEGDDAREPHLDRRRSTCRREASQKTSLGIVNGRGGDLSTLRQ